MGIAVAPLPAQPAEPPDFEWEIDMGLADGMALVAENTANPLRVTLSNQRGDFEGTLRIHVTRDPQSRWQRTAALTYEIPVELPLNSRKTIDLTFFCPEGDSELEFHLIDKDGNEFVPPELYGFVNLPLGRRVVVALTPQTEAWNALRTPAQALPGLSRQTLHLSPTDFPTHWSALAAASTVLWDGERWPRLDDRQGRALDQWVHRGGILVIGSGSRWAQIGASPLADVLPVTFTHSETVEGGGVEGLTWFALTGDVVMARFDASGLPEDARTLLALRGEPVLITWPRGNGHIVLSTVNLDLLFRAAGDEAQRLASLITPPAPPRLATPSQQPRLQMLRQSVADISRLNVPGAEFIGRWVLAMWLLLVPINFAVAWTLRRPRLAWWSIPVIAVLGTAFITQRGLSGPIPQRTAQQFQILRSDPHDRWVELEGLVTLHSPIQDTHSFRFPGEPPLLTPFIEPAGLVLRQTPVEEYTIRLGDGLAVEDLRLGYRAMRTFPMVDMIENPLTLNVRAPHAGEDEFTVAWDAPLGLHAARWFAIRDGGAWEIPSELIWEPGEFTVTGEPLELQGMFRREGPRGEEDFNRMVLLTLAPLVTQVAQETSAISLVGMQGEAIQPVIASSANNPNPTDTPTTLGTTLIAVPAELEGIGPAIDSWTAWEMRNLSENVIFLGGWNPNIPNLLENDAQDVALVFTPIGDSWRAMDAGSLSFRTTMNSDMMSWAGQGNNPKPNTLHIALFNWERSQWVAQSQTVNPQMSAQRGYQMGMTQNPVELTLTWNRSEQFLHPLTGAVLAAAWTEAPVAGPAIMPPSMPTDVPAWLFGPDRPRDRPPGTDSHRLTALNLTLTTGEGRRTP